MLRLPRPIRFRPPREREPEASVADRLRELPTAPRQGQADQLQMAALAARLTDILTKEDAAPGDESGRLTRLDMQSELLLRRMAVVLRKQAPKVSMTE